MLTFEARKKRYFKFIQSWVLECGIVSLLFFITNELAYIASRCINAKLYGTDGPDFSNDKFMTIFTSFDYMLPFVKEFIVIYLLVYPLWIVSPFLIYGFCGRKRFYEFICAGQFLALISFIIFIIFPNGIHNDFRPTIDKNSKNLFDQLCLLAYGNDALDNAFPSGHWSCTILIPIFMRSDIFKRSTPPLKRSVFIGTYIYAILICLSTLFVKQHYIFDGFISVVLCETLYLLFKHYTSISDRLCRLMHYINCQLGITHDTAIPVKHSRNTLMWIIWGICLSAAWVGVWFTNIIPIEFLVTISFWVIWIIGITLYYLLPWKTARRNFRDYNTPNQTFVFENNISRL